MSSENKITEEAVKKRLYEEFIEPTKNGKKDFIGIEIELPILNLDKKPVNFNVVHKITEKFLKQFPEFEIKGIDKDNNIYLMENPETKDNISYDCSYNNIEFSMGKEKNLYKIYERFKTFFNFFQEEFKKYNHILTGMGVNPYWEYNNNVPIPNERYQMLYHHLCSYPKYKDVNMYFHNYPNYGLFSSASQVQLDVAYDDLVDTINAFSKLEPIKAVLFCNSLFVGENEELMCCRDMFWENSTHGINPHNIGMYDIKLESIDDLQAYIESLDIYCAIRNDKYINFKPIGVLDYFKEEEITGEYFINGKYESITFKPELDDITFLRPFKFENLTFRGTIEYRSVCTQPIKDSMTVGAFHLGLKHNLKKLINVLDNDKVLYHRGYNATELRKLLIHKNLPDFINKDDLYDLTREIVNLSYEGLEKRGYGEEKLLNPLYDRIDERLNPAQKTLTLKNKGMKIEDIAKKYSQLK